VTNSINWFKIKMKKLNCLGLCLALSGLLTGCLSSTKVILNKDVKIQKYGELYFVAPDEDPRNVVPQVVEQFRGMGFNVRVLDSKKPIEGVQGTGFFVSDENHILTCSHVMGDENKATVWVSGTRYEADLVNKDEKADLALLKIRTDHNFNISPLSFRKDKGYAMGEDVFTIGYPMSRLLGNSARLSKGLISSTKGLKDDPNQVQVSTEIQPGNSGGPLFDKNGLVVGVIQQTLNPWKMLRHSDGALPQNVNFAIKSDIVLDFLKSKNQNLYTKLTMNQETSFEKIESNVVKVCSGIIPEELENKPKLIAVLAYQSLWDVWYRFRFFVISFYDFDSQDLLFIAGQGHDDVNSGEEIVIKDTFKKIRKTLDIH